MLQSVDPKFFVKFSQFTDDTRQHVETGVLTRALNLLEVTGDYTALIPRLNALTNHADERIRSKAVKALCGLRPNKALLKRQLQAEDSRVRANAVEGIWYMQGEEATDIFRQALADKDHRVVVNALLGLHYQNDPLAFDRLLNLANHSSAGFRAAAAWALGRIGNRRAIPALEALVSDASEMVQKRAVQVLSQFPAETIEERVKLAQETIAAAAEIAQNPLPVEPEKVQRPEQPTEPKDKTDDFGAPRFRLF